MMEQNIIKNENEEGEEFLSSIDALQNNISKVKDTLEKEFLRKDQKHKENLQKTKEVVDEIVINCNKKLSLKEKEIEELKRSVKTLIERYEEIIAKKDDYLKNLNGKIRSELVQKNESPEAELSRLRETTDSLSDKQDSSEKKISESKESPKSGAGGELSKRINEAVDKIILKHKKKLKEKDDEIEEVKRSVKALIDKYEDIIRAKDKDIKVFQEKQKLEEINVSDLKKLGLTDEVIALSKEKILAKITDILKENLVLEKKSDFFEKKLIKKEEEYLISKKAFEDNLESIQKEFSKALEKNTFLEGDLSSVKEKINILSLEKSKESDEHEKRASQMISHYEEKLNEEISKKTREQIDLEVSNSLLQKQLIELTAKSLDEESKKEEFLKSVEEKIRKAVAGPASDFFNNYKQTDTAGDTHHSRTGELSDYIKNSFSRGDTKEKIISDLKDKGFERTEILSNLRKLKE